MASRSIRWPIELRSGRAQYTDDPAVAGGDRAETLRQTIRLRLFSGASTNPWNNLDRLGVPDQTFRAIAVRTEGGIRAEIKRHFQILERRRRAKLQGVTITRGPGTLAIAIEYDDLETGGRERLEVQLGGS